MPKKSDKTEFYLGNPNLPAAGAVIAYEPWMIKEIQKAKDNILYFAEKAFEMQRDEFDQAIWFGIDMEYGKIKRDDKFRSILDQFIYKIKNN